MKLFAVAKKNWKDCSWEDEFYTPALSIGRKDNDAVYPYAFFKTKKEAKKFLESCKQKEDYITTIQIL